MTPDLSLCTVPLLTLSNGTLFPSTSRWLRPRRSPDQQLLADCRYNRSLAAVTWKPVLRRATPTDTMVCLARVESAADHPTNAWIVLHGITRAWCTDTSFRQTSSFPVATVQIRTDQCSGTDESHELLKQRILRSASLDGLTTSTELAHFEETDWGKLADQLATTLPASPQSFALLQEVDVTHRLNRIAGLMSRPGETPVISRAAN